MKHGLFSVFVIAWLVDTYDFHPQKKLRKSLKNSNFVEVMGQRQTTTDTTVNMDARITIRLSPYLNHELTRISTELGVDRSLVLRAAFTQMLNQMRNDDKQG